MTAAEPAPREADEAPAAERPQAAADGGRRTPGDGDGAQGAQHAPGDGAARDTGTVHEVLARGELTVRGAIREASNAVLYCTAALDGREIPCVYKPIAGERPLWDFPDGTLAEREVAAYEICRACGWDLIPPTVLRDGPYGRGMCQLWVDADPDAELLALVEGDEPSDGWKPVGFAEVGEGRAALLVHADDVRLRRLAVLDAVINNADRKGGHLLPTGDGRLHAIDHGITLHAEDKLRTLLWGWAGEPLPEEAVSALRRLRAALAPDGRLAVRLGELITDAEVDAVRARVARLLEVRRHPEPGGSWPAIPWPPV